jgi:hypothetical protein
MAAGRMQQRGKRALEGEEGEEEPLVVPEPGAVPIVLEQDELRRRALLDSPYCIDARRYGNVARFIRRGHEYHGKTPNLRRIAIFSAGQVSEPLPSSTQTDATPRLLSCSRGSSHASELEPRGV